MPASAVQPSRTPDWSLAPLFGPDEVTRDRCASGGGRQGPWVERAIARGGVDPVLLAVDQYGRRVALEVMPEPDDDASLQSFVREMVA